MRGPEFDNTTREASKQERFSMNGLFYTSILMGSQKVILTDGFVKSPSSRRANTVE
jgi:hypothetical protein